MRIKKLLVQFEYDPSQTRWLYRDDQLAHFLVFIMKTMVEAQTAGPIPSVTVIVEEQLESATSYDGHA